jgi:hypothetical protein
MAFDPAAGIEGRLRLGGSDTVVAGIRAWRINKQITLVPIPHFELTADGDGVVWNEFLKGLAGATGTLQGWYDTDATTKTEGGTNGITVGATLSADLLFTRGSFGYTNVSIIITGFEAGTAADATTPADFTATFTVNGNPGKAA